MRYHETLGHWSHLFHLDRWTICASHPLVISWPSQEVRIWANRLLYLTNILGAARIRWFSFYQVNALNMRIHFDFCVCVFFGGCFWNAGLHFVLAGLPAYHSLPVNCRVFDWRMIGVPQWMFPFGETRWCSLRKLREEACMLKHQIVGMLVSVCAFFWGKKRGSTPEMQVLNLIMLLVTTLLYTLVVSSHCPEIEVSTV